MTIDYYTVLGVTQEATAAEIKQAYRVLAKRYHPDVNKGSTEAEQKFKQVHEAYQVLTDDAKREAYNDQLKRPGAQSFRQRQASEGQKSGHESGAASLDPEQMRKRFDQFFGFSASDNKASKSKNKERNPLDTSDIFNQYFGMKKK